jgi:hypothetical protein
MKTRFLPALALLACVLLGTGCRAMQIHRLEDRVDKLEARAAALEAQVTMLSRK